MKGTYILDLYLKEEIDIAIGSLGKLHFPKGSYLYIGSAMGEYGSSTLKNRVKRHLLCPSEKATHWHIDYFLNNFNSLVNRIFLIPSFQRLECNLAFELSEICDTFIPNFGSSDCKCPSHFFFFQNLGCIKQ
ncbi:MAG: GIY-YIG nuclease family protein [Promethearchaeota archaeon]|jgi:Uri superfamily endonuclease